MSLANGRIVLSLAFLLVAMVPGPSAPWEKTYDFKGLSKKGDKADYTYSVDFSLQGHTIKLSEKIHREIVDVKPDGGYAVKQIRSEMVMAADGMQQPAQSAGEETITYNATGLTIADTDNPESNANRTGNLTLFLKPDKPVAVGEAWTKTVPADKSFVPIAVTATYTVEGEESVGSYKAIKIKFEIKETTGDHPASNSGELWISPSDSRMVKAKSTYSNLPFPGGQIVPSANFEAIRVK